MNYQWYPGHMTKAVRMMQENIKLVDMIIEIVDARIPLSSRNPDIDELGRNKLRMLILNKADLADPDITAAWKKYFSDKNIHAVAMDSRRNNTVKMVKDEIAIVYKDKAERDRKRGIIGRPVRVMVAGIPNVGKSTFINILSGKASAKTGNKPGVTRGKQWIAVDSQIQMLDTPGILWPKFEDEQTGINLALIGSMNDVNLDVSEMAIILIKELYNNYPEVIGKTYGVTDEQIDEFLNSGEVVSREAGMLAAIAVNRNALVRGARPDYQRAALILMDDFRNGKFGRISLEKP